MLKIGLTGGIGSGKTVVSDAFQQLNIPIVDTDIIAREVINDAGLLEKLVQEFGNHIISKNNLLDRNELRKVAFKSPQNKQKLDQIMHPLIRLETINKIEKISTNNPDYCIIVVPLLIETKFHELVDRVLVVTAPIKNKLLWLKKRSNLTTEMAKKIMSAQSSDEIKLHYADDHIVNDSDIKNIFKKVTELDRQYKELSQNI